MIARLVLVLVLLVVPAAASSADHGEPHVDAGPNTWDVTSERPGSISGPGQVRDSGTSPYRDVITLTYCHRDASLTDFYGCGGPAQCGSNGTAYTTYGVLPDGTREDLGSFCDEPGDATPDAPALTLAMIAEAFRRVPLPASTLTIQPPGGKTLVNLPTILSTDAAAFTETVTLLGQRVTLDIMPTAYRWVHGDGTEQNSDWAGVEYAKRRPMSAYLSHTYLRADRGLPARVDTTWSARFRVNGGPWQPVPDTVTIEGEPVSLEVVEASPILVGYGRAGG